MQAITEQCFVYISEHSQKITELFIIIQEFLKINYRKFWKHFPDIYKTFSSNRLYPKPGNNYVKYKKLNIIVDPNQCSMSGLAKYGPSLAHDGFLHELYYSIYLIEIAIQILENVFSSPQKLQYFPSILFVILLLSYR